MRLKIFSLLFLVLLPLGARAASPESVLVHMAPENPAPGETVTITLSSFASNLDSVLISWYVDGKSAASGIGEKSFSVQAPAAGGERKITARVALPDGSIEKNMLVRAGVLVLLWQANDSYVPPFYRGKALPSQESEIKIVAMPERGSIAPKTMVYAWQKNYENDQPASGYGKNFYLYTTDYLESGNTFGVTATSVDQKFSAAATINIESFAPKIVFYKNDPALGTLWEQALADGHIVPGEEIIEAAPYFISPKDIRIPSLLWNWSINDSPVTVAGARKNVLPVQAQAGASGTSSIKLELSNAYKLTGSVSKEINVEF